MLDFIKFFNYCCAWLDFGLPESGGNQDLQFYLVLESLNTTDLGVKGVFGSSIFITHISVSITHNSKMVGPIARSPIGTTIYNFVSITQFSDF